MGRVWKNDPIDFGRTTPFGPVAHRKWKITDDSDLQEKLLNYIERWMEANEVGYEEGEHIEDDRLQSAGVANTIGRIKHRRPSAMAPEYWVYGQNCYWWASTMLADTGIKVPASAREQINKQNAGIGTVRRFTDNETAKHLAVMRSQASESFIKGLFLPQKPDLWDIHLRTKGFTMEPDERTDIKP